VRVILAARGAATLKDVSPTFYEELDAEFGGFAGCVLIQELTFDEAWPTWEVHPHGDEIVTLLSGDVDFILHEKGGDRVVRVDQPGTYVVVPRGVWHTARPRARTTMLFFTPGEGTLNAETPG